jgi:hypothetical protein
MCGVLGLAVLLGAVVIFGGMKGASAADVTFNPGSSPPQQVYQAPDGVWYVPVTQNPNTNAFWYDGRYYATQDNRWYQSNDYNGNWEIVGQSHVPAHVYKVYSDKAWQQNAKPIPYEQWKKNGYTVVQGNQGIANFNPGSTPPQQVYQAPDGVYYVPVTQNPNANAFWYAGRYYATQDNRWYQSNDYNGNWQVVDQNSVPIHVYKVYSNKAWQQNAKPIPYGQWKKQGYK